MVALVCLALSLLSAEAGIATTAYLGSYAIFLDRAAWKDRLGSLVPYGMVVILWRLLWNGLGYGVENIGVYIDPLGDPLRYAAAVVDRAPILLLGQLFVPSADLGMLVPPAGARLLWWWAVLFLGCLAILLVPLLRKDRIARFWAMGMLLSILPSCATFPSDRLLVFTSIGAMGLIACLLAATFDAAWRGLRSRSWRMGAVSTAACLLFVHAIVSPASLALRAARPMGPKRFMQAMLLGPLDPAVQAQDLIVVNPPLAFLTGTSPLVWAAEETPFPCRLRILASSIFQPVEIRRPDANTLVVRPRYGYCAWVLDALFRDPDQAFQPGDRLVLDGMAVEIVQITDDGRPLEAAFIFPVPLEDASLRWLQFTDEGFVPFVPPATGQTLTLPSPRLGVLRRP